MDADAHGPLRLRQVQLPSHHGSMQTYSTSSLVNISRKEQENFHSTLVRLMPAEYWPKGSYKQSSVRPIIVTTEHQKQLAELNDALVLAVTDIVERWYKDESARFPERMPLEPQEEDLLRWMDKQEPSLIRPYRMCLGSWRPDFLLESPSDQGQKKGAMEIYRICEINARFGWNGFMHLSLGHKAFEEMGVGKNGFVGAINPEKFLQGVSQLFDPTLPLHLLKDEEPGIGIGMIVKYAQDTLGVRARFITPADLRLIEDPNSQSGYRLCCQIPHDSSPEDIDESKMFEHDGEIVEEIYQVNLELHQREIRALDRKMLQQLSLRCFNDFRTVLLVHDKRMLGIVLQELPSLVTRGILTSEQGDILRKGIASTIIPGSPELEQLVKQCQQSPSAKDEYVLKPIRSGKGAGIIFGEELDSSEWSSILDSLKCPSLTPGVTAYAVQRRVNQPLYDLVMRETEGSVRYPLVGTYHAVNGKLLGLGTWRSSAGNICAISNGGAWFCSVLESEDRNDVDVVDGSVSTTAAASSAARKWSARPFVSVCVDFFRSLLFKK